MIQGRSHYPSFIHSCTKRIICKEGFLTDCCQQLLVVKYMTNLYFNFKFSKKDDTDLNFELQRQ